MSLFNSCVFCQNFENFQHPMGNGICHYVDFSKEDFVPEPKFTQNYKSCSNFISIYDAELRCMNKYSPDFDKMVRFGKCFMCNQYKRCWNPDIYGE